MVIANTGKSSAAKYRVNGKVQNNNRIATAGTDQCVPVYPGCIIAVSIPLIRQLVAAHSYIAGTADMIVYDQVKIGN